MRQLGDGGMGAVYKAADQVLRRFVAVKLLHPNTAENPSAVDRFVREARAAASIGHPNIIDILDFGLEKNRPFLVMEYLRGRALSHAIHHEGPFSIRRACSIATHALAGLAAAHERGILHRDLKPANLMLISKFGDPDFVKLCDFGFATLLTPKERIDDKKSLTPARTLVGTPAYAAPERLRGDNKPDPRWDVYSIGVVLFEMLVGMRPFDAPTFQELAQKVKKEPAPSMRSFRPELPAELDRAVLKALSKNRKDRWPTSTEFAAALVPFGGRSVNLDMDEPSDSFTMDLVKIRARETQRQRTLNPDDLERLRRKKRPSSNGERGQPAEAIAAAVAAHAEAHPPTPSDISSVDIVVSVDDELRSTDSRERPVDNTTVDDGTSVPHDTSPHASGGRAKRGSPTAAPESDRHVRGRVVLGVMRFVTQRFNERALKRVLDGTSPSVRPFFVQGIAADDWVPVEALVALEQGVDARLGRDDLMWIAQCGRAAAAASKDLVAESLPSSVAPEVLVAEVPRLVSMIMKGIECRVGQVGRGYGRLELLDNDPSCLTTCVSMLGFIDGILQHCAAKEVEVNLASCTALGDDRTLYELSWVT